MKLNNNKKTLNLKYKIKKERKKTSAKNDKKHNKMTEIKTLLLNDNNPILMEDV